MNRSWRSLALFAMALTGCNTAELNDHEHLGTRSQAAFVNGSFESGTQGVAPPNWTVSSYANPGVTFPPTSRANLNLSSGGSRATVTLVSANGVESEHDTSLGAGSTLRWPKYGTSVALVNNTTAGAVANGMLQAMTLTTGDIDPVDGKPHVRFTVAPVLENPGHAPAQQPYYFVQLRNVTKSTVLYQDYNASAQPGIPWKVVGTINYTDWQLVDIAPGEAAMGVGDQIELEVIASRCSPSGHFGRVYVDGVGSSIPGLFVSGSGPSGANRGTDVKYTLNFSNGGTGAAGNALVAFTVPTDTTWVGLSAPGFTCTQPAVGGTGLVSCNVGLVSPGASGSIDVTVKINSGSSTNRITAGNYQISATAVNPLLGPKMYTNVTTAVAYTDLTITKTNHLGGVGWGQQVTYDIVVTNAGPSAVSGATVTDNFPAQLTGATWTCIADGGGACGASSGSSNILTSVDLPVGAKATFQVLGNAVSGSGSGTITNTATVAVPGGVSDTNGTNNAAVDSDPIGTLSTITVRKYGNAGAVTSVPSAISCGAACTTATGSFVAGTTVTINAVPGPGETFLGWGGSCSGMSTACTFTVGGSADIFAIFEADPRTNGQSCTATSQCASGQCVDGVCCDTACGGGGSDCQSCAVPGSVGTCSLSDAGTVCAAASCTNGLVTPVSTCGGSSSNCASVGAVSCGGLVCSGSACLSNCASNGDCVTGNYCSVSDGLCKPLTQPGTSCASAVECGSGQCVDGVCCNVACAGQCEACNLVAAPGVCLPVAGAPVGGRAACETDGSLCGGSCDGTLRTACVYETNATTCVAASCAAGEATLRAGCDGVGHCPAAATQDCGSYVCGATACLGDCTVDGDCSNGRFCSGGVCVDERTLGASCDREGECVSGSCVDGVCCDTACEGQCEACGVEGSEGTCSAVTGSPFGARTACVGDGSACAGACDGTEREACSYPDSAVDCRSASCTNDVASLAAECNGSGTCPTLQTQNCGAFVCGATACDGDCVVDGDCASGSYCSGGICQVQLTLGVSCGGDDQCQNGLCVDGVCCNAACSGQCEACNVTGSEGTCSPVSGAPHGVRTVCDTDGSTCGGTCDGATRDSCAFPTETTSCRTAACSDDVATLAAGCDGQGSCPAVLTQACGDFVCGLTACRGDCARTADCAVGSFCSAGVCVAHREAGAACSATEQCESGYCVDGVCCDAACDGQCAACDVEGSVGTCAAAKGAPHAGRAACLGLGDCRGSCDGVAVSACSFPGASVSCSAASCGAGFEMSAGSCDGSGLCERGEPTSCGNYGCSGSACATQCKKDAECASGNSCVNGACEAPSQVPSVPSKSGEITGGGCSVSSNGDSSPSGALTLGALAVVLGLARRRRLLGRAA